ncbi:MAG: acetate--CoA ligase [Desulfovibrio sp.]|jgi:acetyl-CoA synthetase|nr:acetate--CoA ligase [Desulfovibrio sp.]
MSQERLAALLSEKRSYLPPVHGKSSAWISGEREYVAVCRRALEDPEDFWGARASQLLHWFKRWNHVLVADEAQHKYRWFTGAKLNASFNCIDRHLISGRRNKAALIWQGEREMDVRCYTYQMLYTEVCRVAHALSSLRIRKGDHVALYMPMIPELTIAMLACARIGAIHTTIFSGYAEGGVRNRIQDSKARIVITADAAVRAGKLKPLKANLDPILEKCPSVAHVVVVSHARLDNVSMKPNRDIWWHDLIDDFTLNSDFPCETMDANDTLFLLHTSGSTGKPTGIMHSTGGYLTYATHTTQWCFDVHDDDVYWCTADVGWITGHTYGIYGPLALGATTLMFEGVPAWPKPDRYWSVVEKFRVNILYTAPTVIRSLMRLGEAWTERYDISSLRILGTVGEPINPEAWQWYHKYIGDGDLPIVDTWWQTETGGAMISPMPYATKLKPGSAARPLPGIDAAVMGVAEHDGEESRDVGRLVIRRPWPGMMLGVFNDEEKYRSYFSRFGCYESGDGAQVDEDGYFWILGRIDDSINVSGHRLSTVEIEAILTGCPEVAEAAVVPMPHNLKGEAIYAYITPREDVPWSEDLRAKLREAVRRDIGPLASPERIQFVAAMPKTSSGKIIRRVLRKIAAGADDIGDTTSLSNPEIIADIMRGHKNIAKGKAEDAPAEKEQK